MELDRHRQKSEAWAEEAWRLRVQGWTQTRIAEHLGVSQQRVSQILVKTERRLHAEFAAQAEEIKARQTSQLEAVYFEAMEQWKRSCDDAERVTTVTGRAKATNEGIIVHLPDQESRVVEGQSGNPALLEKAMAALASIRAIWGLDAPKRQEVSGPAGGPIQTEAVGDDLDDKITRLIERERAAGSAARADAGREGAADDGMAADCSQ